MNYLKLEDNKEMEQALEKIKNTEWILDKEYTIDEFDEFGLDEVVKVYLDAKSKAESYGENVKVELEYYPYITGVKYLEITFYVEVD